MTFTVRTLLKLYSQGLRLKNTEQNNIIFAIKFK